MDELDADYEDCSNVSPINESIYNQWEEECIDSIEQSAELEKQFNFEKDNCSQKLWLSFQNAACSVAQLYKDRENGVSVWVPFQNAASNVTSLYKDCMESQKKYGDICFQYGVQRRNREILAWARKKKRFIRMEDLIGFLTGKLSSSNNYHHHHYSYIHHRNASWATSKSRVSLPNESSSSSSINSGIRSPTQYNHSVNLARFPFPDSNDTSNSEDKDLQTFREALAFSVGIRSSHPNGSSNATLSANRRNVPQRCSPNNTSAASLAELNEFITNEYSRHVESRKRIVSSTDVTMDSPTHKRFKLN